MHEPSKYQVAIYDWIKAAVDKPKAALMVEAVAGSGKTTTIVTALEFIPPHQNVLFLAFNKHIAEELRDRVPVNVSVSTINSLGWRALRTWNRGVELDDQKTAKLLASIEPHKHAWRGWRGAMTRLIGLKKANYRMTAVEIVKKYEVEIPGDSLFMEIAARIWTLGNEQVLVADFDDQWAVPAMRGLPLPQFDWVFIDEAQDLSGTQVELVQRVAPRTVAIGDSNQAIYGFRGADPDAMENMAKAIEAERLPLSICYRCPSSVVAEAKRIVPVIEASPFAKPGVVDSIALEDLRHEARPGDWVLCRTTAPLVRECLDFIVSGVKATVKGRDIGKQLIDMIDKVNKPNDDSADVVDFSIDLDDYYQREHERLEALDESSKVQVLTDKVESIEALSEGTETVGQIKRRIESVFREDPSPGVTFATAHRSKGLEAQNVFVLRPELMPFPFAKGPWQIRQEWNLKYVAITRAMGRLCWVEG